MSAVQVANLESCERSDNSSDEGQQAWARAPVSSSSLREVARDELEGIFGYLDDSSGQRFGAVEVELVGRVLRLGRVLVTLFLTLMAERLEVPLRLKRGRKEFRRQPPKARLLGTFFGKVRYWRVYMHQLTGRGGGFYPLDLQLGLTADGFSPGLLSRAVQLATKMSFSAAAGVLASFLRWAPSTTSIERAVLGLGAHTSSWFAQAEPPEEDGDILVIQIDSKATPTATAAELRKRRGKRSRREPAPSPRHRGRDQRARRGRKRRRKKGDKSKNGRMATLVVMYTLKRSEAEDGSALLLGPINRRVYASYAPKRHAFAIARREADKRGFSDDSGKLIQLITDGDEDFARYRHDFFPNAVHTLDLLHVVEYLWEAAGCLFREGSPDLEQWVERQKQHLHTGAVGQLLLEHETELQRLPPGRKRDRLDVILTYLAKRSHMMNYDELAEQDLELSSGIVEGAVRYVIAQRFDEGGMRWIRERAEALLQLRCVEINGDWERFVQFVHDRTCAEQERKLRPTRLLCKRPKPLPVLRVTR